MKTLLHDTTDRALAFLDELPHRDVAPAVDLADRCCDLTRRFVDRSAAAILGCL